MKLFISIYALFIFCTVWSQDAADTTPLNFGFEPSPLVDYASFMELAKELEPYRSERLISWEEFQQKSLEPNTLILDTRSKGMYDRKHLKGAIHLNFSDFDALSLAELMNQYEGRNTQILIYCNNNFKDIGNSFQQNNTEVINIDPSFMFKYYNPVTEPLVLKLEENTSTSLALNIPTFLNLYGYGYRNVYELGELLDVKDPRLVFEGSEVAD